MSVTKHIAIIGLCLSVNFPSNSFAQVPESYSKAKKMLNVIYEGREKTFYCGCDYTREKHKKIVDHKSCGYKVRKNNDRAYRVEWEHVVPISILTKDLECSKYGGRKACYYDKQYNAIANDLHNIVPAVGEINAAKGAYIFGLSKQEMRRYGRCDVIIDDEIKVIQPKTNIRGDVARIWLYMSERYGFSIPKNELYLFKAWHEQDPPSLEEKIRDQRIYNIQGNSNHYVTGKQVQYKDPYKFANH